MASANELLQQGIKAAKAKQVAEALALLKQSVELEPRNEMAWLWLSEVVESAEHKMVCLENVLTINPDNEAAQKGLAFLKRTAAPIRPLPERAEEPDLTITPPTTAFPEPGEGPAVRPHERAAAPRPRRAEPRSLGKAIGYIGGIGLLLIVAIAIAWWADVVGNRTRTTPESDSGTYTYEEPSKREALRHIDLARQYVTDIFVPGDDFATGVFRTIIETRLRQAREYLEVDDYANALERLYLVEHDAHPTALGARTVAEHCQEAIRLIQSLRQ